MVTSSASPKASPAAARRHSENARFAVSLGAAFALLCAVVFDTPESQAAAGIFEMIFGGGNSANVEPMPTGGYGAGADLGRQSGQRRHATRAGNRSHAAQNRKRAVARTAPPAARPAYAAAHATPDMRLAERHAIERHHALAGRRAPDARVVASQKAAGDNDRSGGYSPRRQGGAEMVALADASTTINPGAASRRAVCVRACDGYYFPIAAKGSESVAQQSCDRLCPGGQTQVFMMPSGSTKIEEAVSAKGSETYAAFLARLNPDDAKSKSCGCPQTAGNLHETAAFLSDLTLRPGDTIVTPDGLRVVRRGSHYPFKSSDFLALAETHDVPRATRGALYAIDRALRTPYGRLAVASNGERRHHRRDL